MGRRSPQPDGPPPPPVVARVRIRYAKRGRLRFTSHRDVARMVERAVRRAALPVAYTAGFSPHPRISWLGASPTGVASEAEYLEIALSAQVDPAEVGTRLDAALPPDLDVLEAVAALEPGFADRLEASEWELRMPGATGLDAATRALLATPSVLVSRRTKDGVRELDARAAIVSLRTISADGVASCAMMHAVVRHTTPVVRPDDVLTALRAVAALELDAPMVATRLAQGPLLRGEGVAADGVSDPLAADKAAGSRVGATVGSA